MMQCSTGRTRRRTVQELARNHILFPSHARNGQNEQPSSCQRLKVNPFSRLNNMQLCKTRVCVVFFCFLYFSNPFILCDNICSKQLPPVCSADQVFLPAHFNQMFDFQIQHLQLHHYSCSSVCTIFQYFEETHCRNVLRATRF